MSTIKRTASTRNISSTEYCKQAEALELNGKHMAALGILRLAIKKNPRNQEAYKLLGFSLVGLNRFGAAMLAFRKCLTIAPNRMYYHYYLGKTYYLMGKYHLATAEYRKVLNSTWPLGGKKSTNAVLYRAMGFAYLAWEQVAVETTKLVKECSWEEEEPDQSSGSTWHNNSGGDSNYDVNKRMY